MSALHLEGNVNLTFVHIPKCAGISIGRWFIENFSSSCQGSWNTHPTLDYIKKQYEVKFALAIVRNPWDRAVSIYHFLTESKNSNKTSIGDEINNRKKSVLDANNAFLQNSSFEDFEEFVFNISEIVIPTDIWIEGGRASYNQTHWISSGADLIFKFESIENDFKVIQDMTNCYIPLPHLNKSQHLEYQQYYNSDTQKQIAKIFEEDIDKWQYVF